MSPGQTGASVPQFRKVMTFLDFSFLMMMTNLSRILVAIEKPHQDSLSFEPKQELGSSRNSKVRHQYINKILLSSSSSS